MNLIWIWYLIFAILAVISFIAVINAIFFPRLDGVLRKIESGNRHGWLGDPPSVSLLVPARNEAENLRKNLGCLLEQDYPEYEVIVLDDHSTDDTGEILERFHSKWPHLQIIRGKPLEAGWTGKNWACHQLSMRAKGELVIFTDADIIWKPEALKGILTTMRYYKADAFTVWPTQVTGTITERLVVPLMMFSILAYLPEICVRLVPWPVFSAANGQCVVFSRKLYDRIGGHAAVKERIIEDMGLAWNVKKNGSRLLMALGNGLISGRMYRSWSEVRHGFGKNILAGHAGVPFFLILSAVFHWLLFIAPWIWLLVGAFVDTGAAWPELPLALIGLGVGSRALTAVVSGHLIQDAVWMPLSTLLMTVIAGQSLWWHYRLGGPIWKDRHISVKES